LLEFLGTISVELILLLFLPNPFVKPFSFWPSIAFLSYEDLEVNYLPSIENLNPFLLGLLVLHTWSSI